jgi:hypothetical protein
LSKTLDNIITEYREVLSEEKELHEDNLKIQAIIPYLLKLQNHKEEFYGSSWRNYGDTSAFLNLARKFDRIDKIMRDAMEHGTEHLFDEDAQLATETIFDTIADLSLYGLMWSADIAERHPELWKRYLDTNELCKSSKE